MKDLFQHMFPNGLRVIHLPNKSKVAYCGFLINVGSRNEYDSEQGMAHFVEHMIFKGTEKRRSWHILNRMECVGGELNASTSKEETFVYSVFLKEDFNRACELLCDLVCSSVFPEGELEKERDVIFDEINSYRDNPPELIFDDFENIIFENNQLGHNILGDEKTLEVFDSSRTMDFYKRWYQPSNMIFFSMGDFDFRTVIKALDKLYKPADITPVSHFRKAPLEVKPCDIRQDRNTYQGHIIIGNRAFSMNDDRRTALAVLNNILGGPGMNSRLNIALREKRGYVYNVESNFTAYTDTGLFSIYFGTDKENIDKCLTIVNKEISKLRDSSLTSAQLNAAKRQMTGQIGIASENKENMIMSAAKVLLHRHNYESIEDTIKRIEGVSASQILEVANMILDPAALSTLIYY